MTSLSMEIALLKINWKGIGLKTRKRMKKDLKELALFASPYARLGLVNLINNKELSLAQKKCNKFSI